MRVRADRIEMEIEEKIGAVSKKEQAGRSLRIFCCTPQQKDLMLQGGAVAGVEVDVMEPRQRKEPSARAR